MKKAAFWPLMLIIILLISSITPAQAASATVRFTGPDKVRAGQTYTYTYAINVSGVAAARILPVTASGAFEIVSGGEGLMYDTIPNNTSGASEQGTIVVRVKSDAAPGDKATLSTNGDYAVLDEQYKETERVFSASFIADVTTGSASKPTPSPAATPTQGQTPTAAPAVLSPSPEATPSPTAAPVTPSATPAGTAASPTDVTTESPAQAVSQSEPPEALVLSEQGQPVSADDAARGMPLAVIIAVAAAVGMIGVLVVMLLRRSRQLRKREVPAEPAAQPDASNDAQKRADMKRRSKKPRH